MPTELTSWYISLLAHGEKPVFTKGGPETKPILMSSPLTSTPGSLLRYTGSDERTRASLTTKEERAENPSFEQICANHSSYEQV